MSKKTDVFNSHNAIVQLSRKISGLAAAEGGIKDPSEIVALAQAIETEAWTALKLAEEVLEESEFDDLGPTE